MPSSNFKELEDSVTCPVCFKVFDEPQALRCLHTLCRSCVAGMIEEDQISCPVCREATIHEDIKNNFTMKTMIRIYKEELAGQALEEKTKADDHQEQCSKCKSATVSQFCSKCKQLFCTSAKCQEQHEQNCEAPSCKNISVVLPEYLEVLNTHYITASLEKEQLEKELGERLQAYTKLEADTVDIILAAKKEVLAKVDTYFRNQLTEARQGFKITTESIKNQYQVQMDKVQLAMLFTTQVKSRPSGILLPSFDIACEKLNTDISQVKDFKLEKWSHFIDNKLSNPSAFAEEKALKICCIQDIEKEKDGLYDQLRSRNYMCWKTHQFDQEKNVKKVFKQIFFVGNKLWCMLSDCIVICDEFGEVKKTIAEGITIDDDMILSDTGHVVIISKEPTFKKFSTQGQQILDYHFFSVTSCDSAIFAFTPETNEGSTKSCDSSSSSEKSTVQSCNYFYMHVYKWDGEEYVKTNMIPTDAIHSSDISKSKMSTAAAKSGFIYLCCNNEHIYQLNREGKITQTLKGKTCEGSKSTYHQPQICGVDANDDLLVTCTVCQQLFVVNTDMTGEEWLAVKLVESTAKKSAAKESAARKSTAPTFTFGAPSTATSFGSSIFGAPSKMSQSTRNSSSGSFQRSFAAMNAKGILYVLDSYGKLSIYM